MAPSGVRLRCGIQPQSKGHPVGNLAQVCLRVPPCPSYSVFPWTLWPPQTAPARKSVFLQNEPTPKKLQVVYFNDIASKNGPLGYLLFDRLAGFIHVNSVNFQRLERQNQTNLQAGSDFQKTAPHSLPKGIPSRCLTLAFGPQPLAFLNCQSGLLPVGFQSRHKGAQNHD